MPQAALETLLRVSSGGSGGGDGRVTCETLLHLTDIDTPYAESIRLSKQDELDWFDRNVFFERKESTKGNSNFNSSSTIPTTSQRLSIKSKKPSIIGLLKPQTTTFPDSKHRRNPKPSKLRFFPKRLGSAGKFSLRMNEPSSPKVSCMGRVRSDRSRSKTKPASTNTTTKSEKTGFWSSLKKIFSVGRRKKCVDAPSEEVRGGGKVELAREEEEEVSPVNQDQNQNPPGLGGLNRFVSGRRSDSWAGDAVVVETEKAKCNSSF